MAEENGSLQFEPEQLELPLKRNDQLLLDGMPNFDISVNMNGYFTSMVNEEFNYAQQQMQKSSQFSSIGKTKYVNVHSLIASTQKKFALKGRTLLTNNYVQGAFTEAVVANILGDKGVQLDIVIPGDDKQSTQQKENWRSWTKHCGVNGESFLELMKQLVINWSTDGEGALNIVENGSDGEFALRIIDMLLMPTDVVLQKPKGSRRILNGVEVTSKGKKLYYIYDDSLYDSTHQGYLITASGQNTNTQKKLPAEEVLHLYIPLFPGQMRGLAPGRAAFDLIDSLVAYEQTAMKAAYRGANNYLVYGWEKNELADTGESLKKKDTPETLVMRKGGMFEVPQGRTLDQLSSDYPDSVFGPFTSSYRNNIASAYGISTSTLFKDLAKYNFSSSRRGDIDERRKWLELRNRIETEILDPLFFRWADMSITSSSLREKVKKSRKWVFPAWESLQPHQDMATDAKRLEKGIASPQQIMEERGVDPDIIRRERIEHIKLTLEAGKAAGIEEWIILRDLGIDPTNPNREPTIVEGSKYGRI